MFASCPPPGCQAQVAHVLPLWPAPRPEAGALLAKAQWPGEMPELYTGLGAGHKTASRVSSKSQFNVFSNRTKGRNTWYLLSTQALVLKIKQRVRRTQPVAISALGAALAAGPRGEGTGGSRKKLLPLLLLLLLLLRGRAPGGQPRSLWADRPLPGGRGGFLPC